MSAMQKLMARKGCRFSCGWLPPEELIAAGLSVADGAALLKRETGAMTPPGCTAKACARLFPAAGVAKAPDVAVPLWAFNG